MATIAACVLTAMSAFGCQEKSVEPEQATSPSAQSEVWATDGILHFKDGSAFDSISSKLCCMTWEQRKDWENEVGSQNFMTVNQDTNKY